MPWSLENTEGVLILIKPSYLPLFPRLEIFIFHDRFHPQRIRDLQDLPGLNEVHFSGPELSFRVDFHANLQQKHHLHESRREKRTVMATYGLIIEVRVVHFENVAPGRDAHYRERAIVSEEPFVFAAIY